MSKSIIQRHPPQDGKDYDCQCARCGSSCDFHHCDECEDGFIEVDEGDDVVPDMRLQECSFCDGTGGTWRCMSSQVWCYANPLEGREENHRGQIEWYECDE